MTLENMPDIITAQQIANYLQISRKKVYELFQLHPEFGGIPNISIGNSKRVSKSDFIYWLKLKKQNTDHFYLKAVK